LAAILDKYVEFGSTEFQIPEILKVAPLERYGTVPEIAALFGGPEKLRNAVSELQNMLYVA